MSSPSITNESISSSEDAQSPREDEKESSGSLSGRKVHVSKKEKIQIRGLSRQRSKSETGFEKDDTDSDLSLKNIRKIRPHRTSASSSSRLRPTRTSNTSPRLPEISSPKHSPKTCIELTQQLREIYKNHIKISFAVFENEQEKLRSFNAVYMTITRAFSHGIYFFFDDSGRLISLQNLVTLIKKKYHKVKSELQKATKKDIKEFFECNKHLIPPEESEIRKSLLEVNLPYSSSENTKLQQNARICQSILMRLYPMSNPFNIESISDLETIVVNSDKTPIFPPLTFLCSYKDFVTTSQLFHEIRQVLEFDSSIMKWYQKSRVINFCRAWFETDLYFTEKLFQEDIPKDLAKISKIGFSLENEEISKCCMELDSILKNWNPALYRIQSISNPLKIQAEIKNRNTSVAFLGDLTFDLRLLAAESVILLSPFDVLAEKEDSASIFYNRVVNFVINTIINPVDENIEKKIERFACSLEFFIDLALMLSEKKDFFTSFTIYTALHKADILLLFKAYDKKDKSNDNKVTLSKDHSKKLSILNELFDFNCNFKAVNLKIHDCEMNKTFYVPIPSLLKTWMFHKADSNKSLENKLNLSQPESSSGINVEKFASKTTQLLEINKYLNEHRAKFSRQLKNEVLQTDIRNVLEDLSNYAEEDLEKFAKEIYLHNIEKRSIESGL